MRCLVIICTFAIAVQAGEVDPELRPGQGPIPRTLQYAPVGPQRPDVDAQGLSADVAAMRRALQRVQAAVAAGQAGDEQARQDLRAWAASATPTHDDQAEPIRKTSVRFGDRLRASIIAGEAWPTLDASLEGEAINDVLSELGAITDRTCDQIPGAAGRRPISLRVKGLPMDEALDRLLGQSGYAWRTEKKSVIVVDPRRDPPSAADREQAARRALHRASVGTDARAAEALWMLGKLDFDAGRPVEALRHASALVDRFATQRDTESRPWAMRGLKLSGDAMVALTQLAEARSMYRAYRLRALAIRDSEERQRTFPDLAEVYMAGAAAAQQLGTSKADPVALDEAVDELHQFLQLYGEEKRLAAAVAEARLTVGGLLMRARRWNEAETQLKRHAVAAQSVSHQVRFWLAECAWRLGRSEEAAPIYEQLVRWFKAGTTQAPTTLYADSAERLALCLLDRPQPKPIEALLVLMQSRRVFRGHVPSPEALIATARCYAELERDDMALHALSELMKADSPEASKASSKDADAATRQELDRMLGDLLGRTREYPGAVRAKVLFYMGQAAWRIAERDRSKRAAAATDSAGFYQRVLDEKPSEELEHAARIGLARAALAAGQDERAVVTLKALLRDKRLSERDRELCAGLLGGHYRDRGLLREAINAYKGEVSE